MKLQSLDVSNNTVLTELYCEEGIIMQFEYTDGCNKDFIGLCYELDNFLNALVGGEENRKGWYYEIRT